MITREAEWSEVLGTSAEAFLIEICLPAIWSRTVEGSSWSLTGSLSPHVLQSFDLDFGEGEEATIKEE